jgi:hypothetical protein
VLCSLNAYAIQPAPDHLAAGLGTAPLPEYSSAAANRASAPIRRLQASPANATLPLTRTAPETSRVYRMPRCYSVSVTSPRHRVRRLFLAFTQGSVHPWLGYKTWHGHHNYPSSISSPPFRPPPAQTHFSHTHLTLPIMKTTFFAALSTLALGVLAAPASEARAACTYTCPQGLRTTSNANGQLSCSYVFVLPTRQALADGRVSAIARTRALAFTAGSTPASTAQFVTTPRARLSAAYLFADGRRDQLGCAGERQLPADGRVELLSAVEIVLYCLPYTRCIMYDARLFIWSARLPAAPDKRQCDRMVGEKRGNASAAMYGWAKETLTDKQSHDKPRKWEDWAVVR